MRDTNPNFNGRRSGHFGNTVTNQQYEQFKDRALNNSLIRREVSLADITVLSETKVRYGKTEFEITEDAFASLVRLLGLSKAIMHNFENALGKQGRDKLIDLMRVALSTKESKGMISLVLNKTNGVIVEFRKNASSVLSNQTYFNLFEDVMNNHSGMAIKRMSLSQNGSVEISVVNPNWEFQVAKLSDEYFQTGLVFINKSNQTIVSPFNERLICTNGMVISEQAGSSIVLKNADAVSVTGFFDQVRNLSSLNHFEQEFKGTVLRMMKTVASYGEMHHVYTNLKYHLTVENSEVQRLIDSFIPLNAVRAEYVASSGMDIENHSKYWKKAETNVTVWELVNALTDISSHPEKYELSMKGGDRAVFALQKIAGELAFKKEYDLEMDLPNIFDTRSRIANDFSNEPNTGLILE